MNEITLNGRSLTLRQLDEVARHDAQVVVTPESLERCSDAHQITLEVAEIGLVYGQNTGVGANKNEGSEMSGQSNRLIDSHSGGAGKHVAKQLARGMMAVRLNQLANGGSGVNPKLLDALQAAINKGLTPPIRKYGAVGTGDLTALGTTARCLEGKQQWNGGNLPAYAFDRTDSLAFMSSSALTLSEGALATLDIIRRLQAGIKISALSYVALAGSIEALSGEVQKGRFHPGQSNVAAVMAELLDGNSPTARSLQDRYSLRAFPQVHGPAIDAAQHCKEVLEADINSASENPLVDIESKSVLHNGNFHTAYAGQALDALRTAVFETAVLGVRRLGALMNPELTGLKNFLVGGPPGSSGALILEYAANSALSHLRHLAIPAGLGETVLSLGTEEHASFATQAAWSTAESVGAYDTVLASELIAATRALRQQKAELQGSLGEFYRLASSLLNADMLDRPLEADLDAATKLIESLET